MRDTGEIDLLGDLKTRAKKAIDTKRREALAEQERLRREALAEQERLRREALAEQERLRREEASRRRLQEKARRRTEAFRLAKGLCMEAAWKQQERAPFPESLEEFRGDIAEQFGLTIGSLLVVSNAKCVSDTVSIIKHLEPTLIEEVGGSLLNRLLKCKLGDWHEQDPSKDVRDAISRRSKYLSLSIQQLKYRFCMGVQREVDAIEALKAVLEKVASFQLQIECYIKHQLIFSSAYLDRISRRGDFHTVPEGVKVRIAKEELEAIGVTVSDVQEFFILVSWYEANAEGAITEDIAEQGRLKKTLTDLANTESTCAEQLFPLFDQLYCQVAKISQVKTETIAELGRLNKALHELAHKKKICTEHLLPLLKQLDREVRSIPQTDEAISIKLGSIASQRVYLNWNKKGGNCSSTVALLQWLSGTKGQSLKQKILAYFRESADEGRKTASITVAMRSSGAVICLKNLPCEVGFPCDMDDIACMLKSLGLRVSSRELESGEISFKFRW